MAASPPVPPCRRCPPTGLEQKLQHFDFVFSTFRAFDFNILVLQFQHFKRQMLNVFKENVENMLKENVERVERKR